MADGSEFFQTCEEHKKKTKKTNKQTTNKSSKTSTHNAVSSQN